MIGADEFRRLLEEDKGRFPLLTLDEFFSGNSDEDSIAPNQWGYMRPPLAEIWEMFQKVERMSNVAWVRVALHYNTDSIVVCTDLKPDELKEIVNCEWLCSEGAIESALCYSRIPVIPRNYNCLEIVWD